MVFYTETFKIECGNIWSSSIFSENQTENGTRWLDIAESAGYSEITEVKQQPAWLVNERVMVSRMVSRAVGAPFF